MSSNNNNNNNRRHQAPIRVNFTNASPPSHNDRNNSRNNYRNNERVQGANYGRNNYGHGYASSKANGDRFTNQNQGGRSKSNRKRQIEIQVESEEDQRYQQYRYDQGNKYRNRDGRGRDNIEENNYGEKYDYGKKLSKKKQNNQGSYVTKEISISSQEEDDQGIIRFQNQEEKLIASQKEIIPWMSNSTSKIKDSLLRFHNEIIQFYNYIKPSKKSHSSKLQKSAFIKQLILSKFPQCQVIPFGSFSTGLYLPDSDIDIAILSPPTSPLSPQILPTLHKTLLSSSFAHSSSFSQIDYIRKSKVPLLKFQYQGLHFDLSVDKIDGIEQIKYVQKINQLFPQFKYLVFVFKCMLRIRGLADTYTGGLGSFLLTCMVWVYLRTVHVGERGDKGDRSYLNLGEHVIGFMKFYAIDGDWAKCYVDVREGRVLDKDREREGDGYFSCISPQDGTHDIGKSAFRSKEVFSVLRNRCRYILDKNFAPGQSILRVLVNPCDEAFRYLKENQE